MQHLYIKSAQCAGTEQLAVNAVTSLSLEYGQPVKGPMTEFHRTRGMCFNFVTCLSNTNILPPMFLEYSHVATSEVAIPRPNSMP